MKKVLRTLMLAALMLPFASQAQTMYLTVADSTATNSNVPVYGLWADSYLRCQTIYPASMLTSMDGESILGVSYYLSSTATAAWTGTFEVKVKEVTDDTLTAFADMTGATTVYTGLLDASSSPMAIEFSTPYSYQGGNLLVEVNCINPDNYKSATFYGITANNASWQGYSSSSWAAITGSVKNFIPKTTFMYGTAPTCFKVQNLAVVDSLTTTSSITLSWTDTINTGATYSVYDMSDTTEFTNVTVTGNTAVVSGLNAATLYNFGVMTDCGSGDVAGYATASAQTACEIIDVDGDNPFTESFDDTYFPPVCWTRAHTAGSSTSLWQRSTTTVHTGAGAAQLPDQASGNKNNLVTPQLNIPTANAYQVSFWIYRNNSYSSKTREGVKVWVNTTPDTIGGTPLMHIRRSYTQGEITETATGWYEYAATIPTSGDLYVVFEGISEYGAATYIDDIAVQEVPTCFKVQNLVVVDSLTTSSSITLAWDDTINTSATYAIYDMSDTTEITDVTISDNVATIEGLDANTTYTFGVMTDCGGGDVTSFVFANVRTACGVASLPFSENFDNWTSKSECWSFLSGAYNGGAGTPTAYSSAWNLSSSYGDYITISGKALTMNVYSTNRYWAVTPSVEISSNDVLMTVDVAVAAWSAETPNYDADDTLAIAIKGSEDTTWTTLQVLDNAALNALTGTYTTLYIPVSGYMGETVRFAFFAGSSASGGDNRMVIDNITIDESTGDICFPVTGVTVSNVTESGVTLSWNGTDAVSYSVFDMADPSTALFTVTDTAVSPAALTASTQYTYGIVANCSDEDHSDTVVITFRTACGAIALPYTEDFENGIDCWNIVDGDYSTGVVENSSYTTYAYSGTHAFKFGYNTNPPQYLISPEFTGADNGMELSFMYKAGSATWPESFVIGYSTTTSDTAAFTWGTEVTDIDTTEYVAYSETLPAGTKYVCVKYTANNELALYIDSMVFEAVGGPVVNNYTVTVNVNNATMGHVEGIPTAAVAEGTVVNLTAVAENGYRFVNWSNGVTTAALALTVVSDTTVTANFEADVTTYTLHVHYDAIMGNVTATGLENGVGTYAEGTNVLLTATANTNYEFVAWVDGTDTVPGNTYNVVMNADKMIVALFRAVAGIDDVDMTNVKVYSVANKVVVRGAEGQQVYLFDINGRMMQSVKATENVEFVMAADGVYLVKVGNAAAQRVIVIR